MVITKLRQQSHLNILVFIEIFQGKKIHIWVPPSAKIYIFWTTFHQIHTILDLKNVWVKPSLWPKILRDQLVLMIRSSFWTYAGPHIIRQPQSERWLTCFGFFLINFQIWLNNLLIWLKPLPWLIGYININTYIYVCVTNSQINSIFVVLRNSAITYVTGSHVWVIWRLLSLFWSNIDCYVLRNFKGNLAD